MKLVILAEASNVHTRRWAQGMVRRGWGTTVLSARSAPIEGVTVLPIRVPGFSHRHPYRWWTRYARYLRAMVGEAGADLVHVHFLRDYPLTPAAAGDAPVVVSTWGSDVVPFETDQPDRPAQRRRKVALLQGAAAVTATTGHLADRTAEFGGISRESVTVIPFGVDWRRFELAGRPAGSRPPVVGFVKHLEARYGIQHLVEALPAVLERFGDARLVVYGEGPMGRDLVRRAGQLSVGRAIQWRGRIPNEQVPAALAQMDVLVMPSMADAFGVSAVEAQAAGVPVVFSDLPGVREAVTDGVGGLAVAPGDPAALAAAICRLLADEPLRRRLGEGGRRTVREHFDFEDNLGQMESVYRKAMQRRACAVV